MKGYLGRHEGMLATKPGIRYKIARKYAPTAEASQSIDLVGKGWDSRGHLSRPTMTPSTSLIHTSNQ
jgi:hypothetical protein